MKIAVAALLFTERNMDVNHEKSPDESELKFMQ